MRKFIARLNIPLLLVSTDISSFVIGRLVKTGKKQSQTNYTQIQIVTQEKEFSDNTRNLCLFGPFCPQTTSFFCQKSTSTNITMHMI